MTDARERILAAVRQGLAKHPAEVGIRDPGSGIRVSTARRPGLGQAGADDTGRDALREAFSRALTAIGGHVHTVVSPAEAIECVATLFDRYGAADFISWDDGGIPCPGLLDALTSRGHRRVTYDVPFDQEGRAAVLAGLEPIGVGLTGGFAAVAASGTVLLASGAGRGRLPSLLPPVHIAAVRARDLYPTLEAAMMAHPSIFAEASNVVCITGPSRTADIEMTLTHGVHGPKHLHVVILTEGAS